MTPAPLTWEPVFKKFKVPVVKQPYLPHRALWFRAYDLCTFDATKVVILGQDPYHTKGVPDGLAFSTQPNIIKRPPSLRNIFSELVVDQNCSTPRSGDLSSWASSGVLLLNTSLTVAPGNPGSHRDLGWWHLVRNTLRYLSDEKDYVAFILWGKDAQVLGNSVIDTDRHSVLCSSHPSPYSANISFFGSKPFSKANELLVAHGKEPIEWSLP